jgi:FixJ family two-component response regulator
MSKVSLNNLSSWMEFRSDVIRMHPDFFENLSDSCSNLTSREIKLCALILMECDTKTIAELLEISMQGIYTAESKLRTKFSMNVGQKIHAHLQKLARGKTRSVLSQEDHLRVQDYDMDKRTNEP